MYPAGLPMGLHTAQRCEAIAAGGQVRAAHTRAARGGGGVGAECGSVLPLSQGQQVGDALAPFCGQALGRSMI